MRGRTFARIRYSASRAVDRLGRVPGLYFVGAYILLILVFAGLYCTLPGKPFYHSTSPYERTTFEPDATRLRDTLASEIRARLESRLGTLTPVIGGWKLDASELVVSTVSVRNFPNSVDIHLSAPLMYEMPDGGVVWSLFRKTITFPMQPSMKVNETVYFFLSPSEESTYTLQGIPPEPSLPELFPYPGRPDASSTAAFAMSPSLYQRMLDFGEGYRGFPTRVSGQYLRMLYFSAGIATSSALGDIAPVTPAARLAVTAQALLSLVLVGLFFNAQAAGIGRCKERGEDRWSV